MSHVPEVTCVDLHDLFREDGADDDEPLVILLASDGVWDNWRFADTIKEIQSIRQNLSDSSAPEVIPLHVPPRLFASNL